MRRGDYKSIHGTSPKSHPPESPARFTGSKILIFTLERFETHDDINQETFRVSNRKSPDYLKINTVY
jgi:hypothetical protein